MWLVTTLYEYGTPGVSLGHVGGAFNDQLPLLDFSLMPSWKPAPWPSEPWELVWHQRENSPPPSHPQLRPDSPELTSYAYPDPAESVSSGTLPPVCSGDSLSVQSTFSFSWLPVVALGSLILSLEQLSNPVLMQSLELMCNCVESCRKAWNCLPRGWRLGCVTSVRASDIDPYPLSTCCYLLFLFVRLSCGFPMYESLRHPKDMKVPVVRKSKANVAPFICVFRSEMKGVCIWKYEHFSPSLVSLALICSLKCIIWNLYMDIDFT